MKQCGNEKWSASFLFNDETVRTTTDFGSFYNLLIFLVMLLLFTVSSHPGLIRREFLQQRSLQTKGTIHRSS